MQWHDEYGFIHLKPFPDPEQSENGPMYTGLHLVGKYLNYELHGLDALNFFNSIKCLFREGDWYTTPISKKPRFSHDNFIGVICGLKVIEREMAWSKPIKDEIKTIKKMIPIFHKQMMHPRDLALLAYFKYSLWFLAPIIWLAMIVSCWEKYKVRNGNKIFKTDGKIISLMMCAAFDWPIVFLFCDWAIRNIHKMDWSRIMMIYFKNPGHPAVEQIQDWEMTIYPGIRQ